MLQSIEQAEGLLYNETTKEYEHAYRITDNNFGIVLVPKGTNNGDNHGILQHLIGMIIVEYGKRNLNVAANLAVLFRLLIEKCAGELSMIECVNHARKYQPLFTPAIEASVIKYLALI